LTITYNGFVNGEGPADITEPSISTTADNLSPVGDYPITLSGGNAANYDLTLVDGILSVVPPPDCNIPSPGQTPVCGLNNNLLDAIANNGNTFVWTVSSPDNSWTIDAGQGTSQVSYTAGSKGTAGTFTLTFSNSLISESTTCSITINSSCEEYCSYSQGFWGNPNSNTCGNGLSGDYLNTLLSSPLVLGGGNRMLTIGTNEGPCMQSKLPANSTSGTLPVGNESCATATSNQYIRNGRFKNNLLGQQIALSLALRGNPAVGAVQITGNYVTTYASTSCIDGVAIPGTKQVNSIPQSVLDYLGSNNTIADLVDLANLALSGSYSASGSNPSHTEIGNAVSSFVMAFDNCRILVGFSNSSAGLRIARADEEVIDEGTFQVALYPNPTSNISRLEFIPEQSTKAALEVYNMNGSLVSRAFEGEVLEGQLYQLDIDAHTWTEGIYFIRLTVGDEARYGKLIVIRK